MHRDTNSLPWGHDNGKQYHCLVYWKDGKIWMTVNEYRKLENGEYDCSLPYSILIGDNIEDYEKMTEEQLASKAYDAWMTGAR